MSDNTRDPKIDMAGKYRAYKAIHGEAVTAVEEQFMTSIQAMIDDAYREGYEDGQRAALE